MFIYGVMKIILMPFSDNVFKRIFVFFCQDNAIKCQYCEYKNKKKRVMILKTFTRRGRRNSNAFTKCCYSKYSKKRKKGIWDFR
ncbi:hypothetical protein CVT45_10315 [Enterococcus faecium Com15]|nr:hypothetical protein CVT45_10315 [Enterococcus faecium Com15]